MAPYPPRPLVGRTTHGVNPTIGCPTHKGSRFLVALFTPIHRALPSNGGYDKSDLSEVLYHIYFDECHLLRPFLMRNPWWWGGISIDCQRRIGYLWAVLSAKSSNR